jgi:hypothetical protein
MNYHYTSVSVYPLLPRRHYVPFSIVCTYLPVRAIFTPFYFLFTNPQTQPNPPSSFSLLLTYHRFIVSADIYSAIFIASHDHPVILLKCIRVRSYLYRHSVQKTLLQRVERKKKSHLLVKNKKHFLRSLAIVFDGAIQLTQVKIFQDAAVR